jgi:hypothetical protein
MVGLMAAIVQIPWEGLRTEHRALIREARDSRALSSDLPVRIWAHRPELAEAQLRPHTEIHERRLLDGRLMGSGRLARVLRAYEDDDGAPVLGL